MKPVYLLDPPEYLAPLGSWIAWRDSLLLITDPDDAVKIEIENAIDVIDGKTSGRIPSIDSAELARS